MQTLLCGVFTVFISGNYCYYDTGIITPFKCTGIMFLPTLILC